MALRSRLISDPNEVLRIIDENDSENDKELQEADISLIDVDVVTPVQSDRESDSIDPIASGSGVVSTVVASATSGNVHPDSSSDTDSYSVGEQEQDDVS